MTQGTQNKFQEKTELTYEQLFRNIHQGQVTLVRVLEPVFGKEKVHEAIRQTSEARAVESVKRQTAKNPITDFQQFVTAYRELIDRPNAKRFQTIQVLEETKNRLALRISECIWAKTFRDLAAADLGLIMFCNSDFATAHAFNPKIQLRRSRTLMEGHDCCDHVYVWQE